MSGSAVRPFGTAQAGQAPQGGVRFPEQTWTLDGGWGWVYLAPDHDRLEQPIILSDGFHLGETDRNSLYLGLNDPNGYPLINMLNDRGYDVVLLGYKDCTASIYDNARTAQQCIMNAIAECVTDTPLVVGGFSMGGIITRYALAHMERMRMDHRTSHYISYDAPHYGASVPISLQAFAYYIKPVYSGLADLIDSPAARQMLWRHMPGPGATPETHADRAEFVSQLDRLGGWPTRPIKLGVANGRGDGQGNGNPAGEVAFKVTGGLYVGTELYLQRSGDNVDVAKLCTLGLPIYKRTSGYPEIGGAPGGTLDSFDIAARTFRALGQPAEAPYPNVCFVPTISAVAVDGIDLGSQNDLLLNVDQLGPDRIHLDEFKTSSDNTGHTEITSELGEWIIERLPALQPAGVR
jgi:hypothetical protein